MVFVPPPPPPPPVVFVSLLPPPVVFVSPLISSRHARLLAWAAAIETGRHAPAEAEVSVPLSLLSRVAFGALTQPDLHHALTEDVCALAGRLAGHAGAFAASRAQRRLSRLEALPDAVLGAIYAYVNTLDVFCSLRVTSRRLRLRVFTPGGVTNLNLSSFGLGIRDALETVPQERWGRLSSLCVSGLDLEAAGAAPAAITALGALGPRLRVLHVSQDPNECVGPQHIPAAVWPTLRELSVNMHEASQYRTEGAAVRYDRLRGEGVMADALHGRGDQLEAKEEGGGESAEWSPRPGTFERLERLSLLAQSQPLDRDALPSTYAQCSRYLAAAVPGRLRVLALQLFFWARHSGKPHPDIAAAVAWHAPHLESFHLTVGTVSPHYTSNFIDIKESVLLPAFPSAHTLVFRAACWTRFALAAASHPALAVLRLEKNAQLDIGHGDTSDAGSPGTCAAGASSAGSGDDAGAGWRAGALRTLQTSRPSTDGARKALTAPGGCGPLVDLCLYECEPQKESERFSARIMRTPPADRIDRRLFDVRVARRVADIRDALRFATQLARSPSLRRLQFDFGGHFAQAEGVYSGDGVQPFLSRLLLLPGLEELWFRTHCFPPLQWWHQTPLSASLKSIVAYCNERCNCCERPHLLPTRVEWRDGSSGMIDTERDYDCNDRWPPTCC